MDDDRKRAFIEQLSRELTDQGKLIEAGWVSLRAQVIPPDAPQLQVDEMRMAFMAGAQHLFGSIMMILEEGEEPTDADQHRMEQIHKELDEYYRELEARVKQGAKRK